MDLVKINNISKSYGDHQALESIQLEIPDNSIFGLLGPNGAGKTTLIRIITQIIMPDQGEILFKNEPMKSEHVRQIGYLPEERGLYKKMKVKDHLIYLARLKGMQRADAVISIKYWLEKLDMMPWANKKVEDLSKGMQQKIQFIATVVHDPALIILDEPFSGFDPVNANMIKDEILELKESGTTIIFSTHRMESVEELCDQVTLIHHANILLNGAKKEIKNRYRDHTFLVEYQEDIPVSDSPFKMLQTKVTEEGIVQSEIRIPEGHSINDLVQYITTHTEIVSIHEKIPSINDIFISTVKPTHHA